MQWAVESPYIKTKTPLFFIAYCSLLQTDFLRVWSSSRFFYKLLANVHHPFKPYRPISCYQVHYPGEDTVHSHESQRPETVESTSLSRPRQLSVPTPVGQGLSLSVDWYGGDWHDSMGHLEKSKWKTGIVYVQNMCVCIIYILPSGCFVQRGKGLPSQISERSSEHHLKRANGAMAHSGNHSGVESMNPQKKPTVNPKRTNNCIKVCGILLDFFVDYRYTPSWKSTSSRKWMPCLQTELFPLSSWSWSEYDIVS